MSGHQRRLVFGDYTRPGGAATDRLYSDSPIVELTRLDPGCYSRGEEPPRTEPQQRELARVTAGLPPGSLPGDNSPFGASLDWPYRGYGVALRPPGGASLLGDWPDQPVTAPVRASAPAGGAPAAERRICLFNVLVALEWYPGADDLQQLAWAFRRASDFLYDVTDGSMAFGQVAVGGPEWMGCADIQILASTRLLPRSWVDGLHQGKKYTPIRVGRGLWNKVTRLSIPWDEPEGYRSLIHEWGHYALGLTDHYLSSVRVGPAPHDDTRLVESPGAGSYTLVVPEVSLPIQSIMAIQQGTSELTTLREIGGAGEGPGNQENEWARLARKREFAFLNLGAADHPRRGPGRLPLPLPYFHDLTGGGPAQGRLGEEAPLPVPAGIDWEHTWVYVLKGSPTAPHDVIAQGTLEASSRAEGFRLLGTVPEAGDTVVLIGTAKEQSAVQVKLLHLATDPTARADGDDRAGWHDATPAAFPLIDVIPQAVENRREPVKVKVRITSPSGPLPDRIAIFPAGDRLREGEVLRVPVVAGDAVGVGHADEARTWVSEELLVATLDGHVLVTWDDGPKLAIASFSEGGGPDSAYAVPDNPTTAGSSEGNIMLFFEDKTGTKTHRDLRVVTTVLLGVSERLPGSSGDSQARSYSFSLAGNGPIPTEFNPTLILYHDPLTVEEEGDLRIYRQDDRQNDGGGWTCLPTYLKPGSSIAATPLREPDAGGRLTAPDRELHGEPRVERYRLYWTRRV